MSRKGFTFREVNSWSGATSGSSAFRQVLAQVWEGELAMDAIARRADVPRLTIYYQFKSRPGLLEALYRLPRLKRGDAADA